MTVKINNRYRLSKEYLDSLTIKPCTELVTVSLMYGDVVSYSDGQTTFTDRIVNIIPHLEEPDFRFNTTSSVKKPGVVTPVVIPTQPDPEIVDPVTPPPETPPVISPEPTPDPVPEPEPTTPEPTPSGNPYDDNYI